MAHHERPGQAPENQDAIAIYYRLNIYTHTQYVRDACMFARVLVKTKSSKE